MAPREAALAGRRSTSTGTPPASASETEVLPWDHLDSGLDKDWLWEDWQDALDRGRGRGLPLDAVLRLRRLPADGHRDPDRPHRPTLLPLTRSQRRAEAEAERLPTGDVAAYDADECSPLRRASLEELAGARRDSGFDARARWRRAAASHVLDRGGGRERTSRRSSRSTSRARPAPPGAAQRGGSAQVGNACRRCATAASRARCWPARSSTRGGATGASCSPRPAQLAFDMRAGFRPTGESLLVLDPRALPPDRAAAAVRRSARRRRGRGPGTALSGTRAPVTGACTSPSQAPTLAHGARRPGEAAKPAPRRSSDPPALRQARPAAVPVPPRLRTQLERALRRAGIPVAYSHGFTPHPRLSWIRAAPTGAASEAEYLEIGLTRPLDPATRCRARRRAARGLDVLAATEAEGTPLADRIDASEWLIELPGVAPDDLRRAVVALSWRTPSSSSG